MDIQHIPQIFWYSLSASLLVVSIGLTVIAYHSSNVSIELADAKINLSSQAITSEIKASKDNLNIAVNEIKSAKADTEQRYQNLLAQNQALQKQIDSLQKQAKSNPQARKTLEAINASKESIPVQSFNGPSADVIIDVTNPTSDISSTDITSKNMETKIDAIEDSLNAVQMSIARLDHLQQEFNQ